MNMELLKEYTRTLKNMNYKEFIGAIILNEKLDYLQDLEDITQKDVDYLTKLYNYYMENDYLNIFNVNELIEEYEMEGGQ